MTVAISPAPFDRAHGIGGSDAGVIMGLSPWRTRADLWMEKSRHPMWRPQRESPAMTWGKILEPVLREHYARTEGVTVEVDTRTYWHTNKVQFGHIDGRVSESRLWEGKTGSDASEWDHGVPALYEVQVQQYMAILGAMECDVSVLLPGGDYRMYRLAADAVLQDRIEGEVLSFWDEFVIDKVAPPEITDQVLLHPLADPDLQLLVANDDDEAAVRDLFYLREQIRYYTEQEEGAKERLRDVIGISPGMAGRGWRIDYKNPKPATTVGHEQIATVLENTLEIFRRFGHKMPEEVAPYLDPAWMETVRSLYTITGRPVRPFVLREVKR